MLAPPELAQMLDERFRVLVGGERAGLERHRTMRACIDWSYALLLPAEQLLFNRLSVFAGGFTLALAESVCSSDGIERAGVLDLLSSLVDKSLVVAERGVTATRDHQLDTSREYAAENSERQRRARLGGVEAYFDLAEDLARTRSLTLDQAWLRDVQQERANWNAALTWALVEKHDTELGLRFILTIPMDKRDHVAATLGAARPRAPRCEHATGPCCARAPALCQHDDRKRRVRRGARGHRARAADVPRARGSRRHRFGAPGRRHRERLLGPYRGGRGADPGVDRDPRIDRESRIPFVRADRAVAGALRSRRHGRCAGYRVARRAYARGARRRTDGDQHAESRGLSLRCFRLRFQSRRSGRSLALRRADHSDVTGVSHAVVVGASQSHRCVPQCAGPLRRSARVPSRIAEHLA